MSECVQGGTASLVTAVPRQAGRGQDALPYAGAQSAGALQQTAHPTPMTVRQLAAGPGTPVAPLPVAPRPVAPRPAAPRPVAPGNGTSGPGACRATVRDELDAALAGAPLSTRDRQFLSKLVHWDKRNAASVASLLRRARRAGRNEAALTPVQLETVLAALEDAVVHRVAGISTVGCWDCEKVRGGCCAEHSRDFERARDYAELAALLAAGATVPAALAGDEDELRAAHRLATPIQRPTDISGYRRRAPIVS